MNREKAERRAGRLRGHKAVCYQKPGKGAAWWKGLLAGGKMAKNALHPGEGPSIGELGWRIGGQMYSDRATALGSTK
jgi:hypothetical protein